MSVSPDLNDIIWIWEDLYRISQDGPHWSAVSIMSDRVIVASSVAELHARIKADYEKKVR